MPAQTQTTNRLAKEKSPYLLQHQHNPVDWMPWGAEAFERAKKEGKPIFLSIGYSTCHWCHVMAHESFEDLETAKYMNEHFVCIKVDREERPDVDKVYMTFVQATTGSGGWPMSVWLTPDLKPFLGGTYFPPQDRGGRPSFRNILARIADGWKNDRDGIVKHGDEVAKQLGEMAAGEASAAEKPGRMNLSTGLSQLAKRFDGEHGGFGSSPKFPQPSIINFLLRMSVRLDLGPGAAPKAEQHDAAALARRMALFTLEKMAAGGMHDHVGGGFHRYSVDTYWHIPHFEKMLYDQAQLARAYVDAFQLTRDSRWEKIARDVLDYVLRDMTDKDGGFCSAEDADSLLEHGKPEHGEGAFYVWTKSEIEKLLGEDAVPFNRFYGVKADGNAPVGSDPMGEFRGKNTLIQRLPASEAAQLFDKTAAEIETSLARSRAKLFSERAKRPKPHLDDKIIVAWNGLMISALSRAAQALDDPRYLAAAQGSAKFIKSNLWRDGALIRSFRHGPSSIAAFADDYAALIAGLLDLYEADFDTAWLQWAIELQAKMDTLFFDKTHGGYFQTALGAADILFRTKEDYDGAEPAPSSLAAANLLRLAQLTDSKELRERAARTIASASDQLARLPSAMTQMLCAVDASLAKPRQIVIAGKRDAAGTQALLREVRAVFSPNQIVLLADGAANQEWLGAKLEFLRTVAPVDDKAAAYVCENFTCQAPITDPAKLREVLAH
ncbi:MAG: thioredoxin domain-containing protein [Chthoniobacteraceae bacterium]